MCVSRMCNRRFSVYKIGTVSKFLAYTDSVVEMDGSLYFLFSNEMTADETTSIITLYKLDIKKEKLSEIDTIESISPLIYVKQISDESFITAIRKYDGEAQVSQVIEFCPDSDESKVIWEASMLLDQHEGKYIRAFAADADNEKMYLLTKTGNGEKFVPKLEVYSREGELEYIMELTGELAAVADQAIAEMSVVDGYLYIQNFSSDAVVMKIDQGESKLLIKGNYESILNQAESCQRKDKNCQIYYVPYTTQLLFLNAEKNEIYYGSFNEMVEEEIAQIQRLQVADTAIWISAVSAKEEEYIYYYTIDELLQQCKNVHSLDEALNIAE